MAKDSMQLIAAAASASSRAGVLAGGQGRGRRTGGSGKRDRRDKTEKYDE